MRVSCSLLLLVILIGYGFPQQCQEWISIDPDKYNETFVDMTSLQANEVRPLGFLLTSLEFEQEICFTVSDTSGSQRKLEVKWDFGDMTNTLCIRNNRVTDSRSCSSDTTNTICNGVPGESDSVTYTLYCSGTGCEGGTKLFWIRFVVEPLVNGTYDENWCSNSRDSQFPSTLTAIPSVSPATTTTKQDGGGLGTHKGSIFIAACSVIMSVIAFLL